MPSNIEIKQLSHTYKEGYQALNNINLSFDRGLYGLLGPNGAGKSTLMKILCTLIMPTEGQVRICGNDVTTDPIAVRRHLGYLPQEFGAWRNYRVEEVLDILARFSGINDNKTRRNAITRVLDEVGLGEIAARKVKKLSGGMLRRLGIAQALIHEPKVIIVDEPTVGLDPEEAAYALDQVIERFPDTEFAEKAKERKGRLPNKEFLVRNALAMKKK